MSGFSLTLSATPTERDELIAHLWEAGTTGVTEEEDFLRAFFDGSANPDLLLQRFSDYHPHLQPDEEHDWVRHSQSMWQPFAVGDRFWLYPEWQKDPAPQGRTRLPMRAGMACGSGTHPATRLCLLALERCIKPGASVLDVGTGSGILAEAATLLGARFVAACDIEHEVSLIARRNVPAAALFTGSLRSIREAAFDTVVANLNAATLGTLAADLRRVAAPVTILSGFREEETSSLLKRLGIIATETLELEGYACIIS